MKIDNNEIVDEEIQESEYYKLILFLFFIKRIQRAEEAWNEFEANLLYKNRFSSDSEIIKELFLKKDQVTCILKKGKILYRARVYDKIPIENIYQDLFKNSINPSKPNTMNKLSEMTMYLLPFYQSIHSEDSKLGLAKNFRDALDKWKRKKFKGYNKKESGAPPKCAVTAGRANPEYIRYLYLAEEEKTAVYEIKPILGQKISVARFKTKKELKIYDLTQKFYEKDQIANYEFENSSLFNSINEHFSLPNMNDKLKYVPTQYLTEVIKNMGFDGIRFNSSLNRNGKNLVIFDPDNCTAISSDLIEIKNIEINTEKVDIYTLERMAEESEK